jgi:hypothetical protein
MEIERLCLQMLRQSLRVLRRNKTLMQRRRRYRPRRRRPLPMIPLHFRRSNSAPQAMEIERPCLHVPLRQRLRVLRRIKTLPQRHRRYWPRRRRPHLMAPRRFRQNNSVHQAMEIERPCLQTPLRQRLRVLRQLKTLTQRRRRYWPRRRRQRLMAPLHGSSRVCLRLRRSASF